MGQVRVKLPIFQVGHFSFSETCVQSFVVSERRTSGGFVLMMKTEVFTRLETETVCDILGYSTV
jgi:hypothetical protein